MNFPLDVSQSHGPWLTYPPAAIKHMTDVGLVPGTELRGITFKNRIVLMDWLGITGSGRLDKLSDGKWQIQATLSTKWADAGTIIIQLNGDLNQLDVNHTVVIDFIDKGDGFIGQGSVSLPVGRIDFTVTVDKDGELK
jgi:hypothetical protein